MTFLDQKIIKNIVLGDILLAVAVMILAVLLARLLTINLRRIFTNRLDRYTMGVIVKVTNYVIYFAAFLSMLPILGLDLSGLLVAGGITGIILGFASQNIASNLISGIFLMIERPITIGHQVNIDGVEGYVEDVRVLSTIMRTYDGLYVRLPNERVFTGKIINVVEHPVRRFQYLIGIRHSDNVDRAMAVIERVVKEHPFALVEPEGQIFLFDLNETSARIAVRIWCPSTLWYEVRMQMLSRIKQALEAEDIRIAIPRRALSWSDETAFAATGEEEIFPKHSTGGAGPGQNE